MLEEEAEVSACGTCARRDGGDEPRAARAPWGGATLAAEVLCAVAFGLVVLLLVEFFVF